MNGQRRFHSIPLRTRRPVEPSQPQRNITSAYVKTRRAPVQPDIGEDERYYLSAHTTPKSAIRYTDEYDREVRQQGRRRVVVKHVKAQRRVHWLFPAGLGMIAMLLLTIGGIWLITWWENHQLDNQYGFPRTWQTNQVVGHDHDNPLHKTHFTFENLDGHVFFVEIPAGDISKAKIYAVITIFGDNAANWPVTATFKDVNGDGRIDILISIQDQTIVYLNDGTSFKPQQQ